MFLFVCLISLFGRDEVDLPRYKPHAVDVRDDLNTLTMERTDHELEEAQKWKSFRGLRIVVLISCKLDDYTSRQV